MKGITRIAFLGVITAAMVLTACGGGSSQAASTQPDTIHIALTAPITGDWSEYGVNFRRSVEMGIDFLNSNGGVLGRQLVLSVGDTGGSAQEAATLAQRWTSDSSIVAQIGSFSSSEAMAAQPIFDSEGMVQLSPTASHTDYAGGSPWSFGIVGTQAAEGPFMANFAYNDLGLRRIAVLHLNNDWGIDTAHHFSEAFTRLGGEIVRTEFYFDGERDFTAVLTRLAATNADGFFMASFFNDGAAIARQKDRIGWDATLLGPSSLYSPQLIELGGSTVDGLYTNVSFFADDPDPAVQGYVAEFQRRYNATPNFHAALAYDSIMLLADAIERAGSTDRAAIRDALAETRNFPGLTGGISFTPAGDAAKEYRRLWIDNGRFAIWEG
jgi:branched-chain amino acid transport system substrate-binding protein